MAKTYRPYVPEQDLLLPPSLRDWLPEDHLHSTPLSRRRLSMTIFLELRAVGENFGSPYVPTPR
jgi:hypothetical protein